MQWLIEEHTMPAHSGFVYSSPSLFTPLVLCSAFHVVGKGWRRHHQVRGARGIQTCSKRACLRRSLRLALSLQSPAPQKESEIGRIGAYGSVAEHQDYPEKSATSAMLAG